MSENKDGEVRRVYIEAWRGVSPYNFYWFTTADPDDRPWKKRTFETFAGKTAVVQVTSDEPLTRDECLKIATMEITRKSCRHINLNEK